MIKISLGNVVILFIILFFSNNNAQSKDWLVYPPAGNRYTELFEPDSAILPNGRIVTPTGKQIKVAPHPYGLVLSPDGSILVTANSGINPFSISIIKKFDTNNPEVIQIPENKDSDEGIIEAVYMGLAISPDNKLLYVAGGQEGLIYIFELNSYEKIGEINCNKDHAGRDVKHGYIGDIILSNDGSTLYAVDQVQFELLIIDTKQNKIIKTVSVGRYPFGLTLSPDESKVYVANVGMFEYKPIEGITKENVKEKALDFPASAYLSKEMIEGISYDSIIVPPLGDPNVPESFSVWTVDVTDKSNAKVISKIKTGFLVGQVIDGIPAVGGASPNSIVSTEKYVFVSNGNNDCISVIDVVNDSVIKNISLSIDERLKKFRGIIPFGLAISPDQKKIFVAESGINAIGVIDAEKLSVVGHIPAGWFPSKIKISNDGNQIYITNAKGLGSGPNSGPNFKRNMFGSYIGDVMLGTVSIINTPSDEKLKFLTQQVLDNNYRFKKIIEKEINSNNPVPLYPAEKESPIKHIIFIAKENRTYDEIFGQIKNGIGLPEETRYGLNRRIKNKNGDEIDSVDIMVNHIELAEQFSISDNYYCDSDVSADGHRWLSGTYPNEWVEVNVASSYGGGRKMKEDSDAPGNHAFVGSSGAIYPEDYNEAGSIWEHMERNKIDFFNFGFGLELAPSFSDTAFKYTGIKYIINYPVPAPIFNKSSKKYATFNTSVPDQFRSDMFIEEFNERWLGENKTMPSVLTILLPNDHGSNERPEAGYPFVESYMMDNDLALGRIIEFLSNTPYWKNMAIFITEDDPQGGVDHVDAHRSILMMVSPYAKKNYVSHTHYSFGSIFKTFWNILGVPYLNQYDACAFDMRDMFSDEPDFTPYKTKMVDLRVFNPETALDPFDAKFDWDAFLKSQKLDDPEEMKNQNVEYEKSKELLKEN
jgi:YVTN family beta-propeller protein